MYEWHGINENGEKTLIESFTCLKNALAAVVEGTWEESSLRAYDLIECTANGEFQYIAATAFRGYADDCVTPILIVTNVATGTLTKVALPEFYRGHGFKFTR